MKHGDFEEKNSCTVFKSGLVHTEGSDSQVFEYIQEKGDEGDVVFSLVNVRLLCMR